MRIHIEAADEGRERLKQPVVVSASCHAALAVVILAWGFFSPPPFQFGDVDGTMGGALTVNVVDGIPLNVPTAPRNPVANPVEHQVPAAPDKPAPPAPEIEVEPPNAVAIAQPAPPKRPPATAVQKSAPVQKPNEIRSTTGAQAASPIFSGTQPEAGSGVGLTGSNPFGQGFAWYSEALQRALGESWRRTLGQASGDATNPAVVRFTILRDGSIRDIKLAGSSGNRSVDYTAQRAVLGISPFRPLPPGLGRSSIVVEMFFQLQ
ncbi:MAG: TonB family protein [Acidobacteria bacterium]|nr:TonB family protein [Acidobacteriota bacterium]MDA1234648.1 TonB family protein [Acidobacteriota bacterium]